MRLEKIVEGEIDEDAPRLDLVTLKKIIEDSKTFDEILTELHKNQPYPDLIFDGSGHTVIVYLLDDNGDV